MEGRVAPPGVRRGKAGPESTVLLPVGVWGQRWCICATRRVPEVHPAVPAGASELNMQAKHTQDLNPCSPGSVRLGTLMIPSGSTFLARTLLLPSTPGHCSAAGLAAQV